MPMAVCAAKVAPSHATLGAASLARPKSSTLTCPRDVSIRLAGLMSRCVMPCACAASRASTIWSAIATMSGPAIGVLGNPLGQGQPLDEFHRDEADAVALPHVVDDGNIGMVERGCRARLADETSRPCRRLGRLVRAAPSTRPTVRGGGRALGRPHPCPRHPESRQLRRAPAAGLRSDACSQVDAT